MFSLIDRLNARPLWQQWVACVLTWCVVCALLTVLAGCSQGDTRSDVEHERYMAWHQGMNFQDLRDTCKAEDDALWKLTQQRGDLWSPFLRISFAAKPASCADLQALRTKLLELKPTPADKPLPKEICVQLPGKEE